MCVLIGVDIRPGITHALQVTSGKACETIDSLHVISQGLDPVKASMKTRQARHGSIQIS